MTLNFADKLAARLQEAPPSRKSDRTREQLKTAAARVLEKKGFNQLRVIDVTNEAGLSEGSFYSYFKDKKEVCNAVLGEFLHFIPTQRHLHMGAEGDPFYAIWRANVAWFACVRANAGLVRCLFQLQDSESDFAVLMQHISRDWYEWVSKRIISQYPEGAIGSDAVIITLYALGGMIDEMTRLVWVNPNPDLNALLKRNKVTDDHLAELLAIIWHRAIYPAIKIPEAHGAIGRELTALEYIDTNRQGTRM
jgi:TetR/AcrR family transcriptional regulator, transcriptional repressor for nem operon